MLIIEMTYKVPLSVIDENLVEHRKFLDECYNDNIFIASGAKNPRTGGVLISPLSDKQQLMDIIANDPFVRQDFVELHVMAFEPTKYHPALTKILCK